ncbi:hypothetical protein FB566_3740 [Stackebrandtia endophytica]|uniref:Uncharacterized protein n=1 Tax=Stackebrandtia endophytica TaxID=1496996 RepID=A0A543B001_9ACTN|nr:hypothetical protein [Stackebrandtia endophytica]TQL78163.1 hypothetical protein FB566_3740 [Stackebrandtia endophytica]
MNTATHVALVADLRDQLRVRLLDSLDILLGDQSTALLPVRQQLDIDAEVWSAQLLDGDQSTASATAARLVAALYPGDGPFDPPRHWWSSPLGRAIACRVGHPGAETVSSAVAAAMLGISRQGVADLIARDKLIRHPDGGVLSASIRDRLTQRSSHESDRRPTRTG